MEAQSKGTSLGTLEFAFYFFYCSIVFLAIPKRKYEFGINRKPHVGFYSERRVVEVFPQVTTGSRGFWPQYGWLIQASQLVKKFPMAGGWRVAHPPASHVDQ